MKHSGKARKAAFKLIVIAVVIMGVLVAMGAFAAVVGTVLVAITPFLIGLWVVFALFTLYFFRDPNAKPPPESRAILSPAHGKVDVIDTTVEGSFIKGECRRISIFLSVVDVHVQNAPIAGKIAFYKYSNGQFLNALRSDCAECNENLLLGFEPSAPGMPRVGVRLIAGAIARRIVPFVQQGDDVPVGERIGLIQFGSRVNVYLPLGAEVKVSLGDRVVGGETILAMVK
jgi:phosphatidylserine decarboxylase